MNIFDDLASFRRAVFGTPSLLSELRGCSTWAEFELKLQSLTVASGSPADPFAVAQLRTCLRKDWAEQWVAEGTCAPDVFLDDHEQDADYSGWLPIRLFVFRGDLWIDWCNLGQTQLTRPFFSEDVAALLAVPFNQIFRRYTPIRNLLAWAERLRREHKSLPVQAVIGHVSRCGSTLISQALAELPSHRVLSEPPMLDVLLNVRRRYPSLPRANQIEWLRAVVDTLAAAAPGATLVVVKLDAWHIIDFDVVQEAFPDAKLVFVIRDPIQVAASHIATPALYVIPGAYSQMPWRPLPESPAWNNQACYLAETLGEIYRSGLVACKHASVRVVDHSRLPDAIWSELRDALALPEGSDLRSGIEKRAASHAKRPQQTYDATADDERTGNLTPEVRDFVDAACRASYDQLRAISSTEEVVVSTTQDA